MFFIQLLFTFEKLGIPNSISSMYSQRSKVEKNTHLKTMNLSKVCKECRTNKAWW